MSTPPNPLFAEFQALADEPSSAESSPILLPTVGSKLRKRKSRVGSTDEEDDDDNEEDELNEEEPLPPPAVTTPSSESVNSSNSPEQTVSASSANSTQSANQNLIVYAKKLATKHRLRPDKAGMLTEFSSVRCSLGICQLPYSCICGLGCSNCARHEAVCPDAVLAAGTR